MKLLIVRESDWNEFKLRIRYYKCLNMWINVKKIKNEYYMFFILFGIVLKLLSMDKIKYR